MKKTILTLGFFLFVISFTVMSQVAMGKWNTYYSYNSVSQITQSDNKIYAISEGALFSFDKLDGNMEFYSKLSGLSDAIISCIKFDISNKQLLIIYKNGNMDILGTGGVTNIPDFYNKQMSSSKDVNQILYYDNKAYLSCNFGIIVLNMLKKEVSDTYYIGPNASEVKVLNITINKDSIYALTASTIFKASITETHLVNFEFWSSTNGLPGNGNFQRISTFGGQLVLLRGGYLYKQETNNSWTPILPNISVTDFKVTNESLNLFTSNNVYQLNNKFEITPISNIGMVSDAEYDTQNSIYYYAANSLGIIPYKNGEIKTPIKPVGPAVNLPWNMIFSEKKLFVVPGGRWAAQNFTPGDVMMYENGIWTNILHSSIQNQTGHPALDFMNVAVDPIDNKHFFVTSFGTGLFEFRNNVFFKCYDYLNSVIEVNPVALNDPYHYMRIDGAVFDKEGNLFLANSAVDKSIKVLLSNGKWIELKYPNATQPTLGKILINSQNENQKWLISARSGDIIVFDDNGTIADQSDDKSVLIHPFKYPEIDNNGLTKIISVIPGAIYTIDQDKNGVIWVGTDVGPFLFNNLSNVYSSDYTCSRVKIPRNDSTNLADYLLVGENIKSIAIDGANRKWLGTKSSGVYLMSENGQQTIQHFTTSNSPLLSNDILSIAINPSTGEVFFGTAQGIVSYQSDASNAGSTFGDVYAYPNPVRQGFTGVITITGLVLNTQVKITDISGNLVCQTVSNGSIATWDGKDVHGRKVNTGIYLAICVNSDGTLSTITKILVIN